MSRMAKTADNDVINAFPLFYGKTMKTSGTYTGLDAVFCQADGSLSILYPESSTAEAVPLVAGDVFSVQTATSVTITDGTFHLM